MVVIITVVAGNLAVGMGVVLIGVAHSRLVRASNAVENAWAHVGVQLKRRHDLVSALVDTITAQDHYERRSLDEVRAACSAVETTSSGPGEQARSETALTRAVHDLMVAVESRPQGLGHAFTDLREELVACESRVAYSRQYYNDVVLEYNNAIATLPGSLLARRARFAPREYFTANESDGEPPRLDW